MKARTKVEKEVMELSSTLPKLRKDSTRYSKKSFYRMKFTTGRKAWCSECGYEFYDKGQSSCPHCHCHFDQTEQTRKKTDLHNRAYFVILDTRNEWQVMRYFRVDKESRAGKRVKFYNWEVMQLWFTKGHYEVIARKRSLGFYIDTFSYWSDMEIRIPRISSNGPLTIEDIPYAYVEKKSVLPQLQRFEEDIEQEKCKGFYRNEFYKVLLAHPMAETLLKQGHEGLLRRMLDYGMMRKEYFDAVKIALRNHYDIFNQDTTMWLDMVEALIYLRKDVHNAFYVCPKDLQKSHDRWIKLAERKRKEAYDKAAEKRKLNILKRDKKIAENYEKSHMKFLGFKLDDGTVVIKVLPTVEAFKEEADEMHHCVFANGYYKKPNSLIMSARVEGKRQETVEVNLRDFTLVQSRGHCNQPSPYHDEIVKLVESHMKEIKKVAL